MGNFTMEDLFEELNKGVINKFERKKVIINYINEIHSCDLVDMTKYSKIINTFLQILTFFQNMLMLFLSNQKNTRYI